MKNLKNLLITAILLFTVQISFSQNITADTTLANDYYDIANIFLKSWELDSALHYTEKAQELYLKHLGETSLKNTKCLQLNGLVYYYASMYDNALVNWLKALEIRLELLGKKHTDVATTYNNIGNVYLSKAEYNNALENYFKGLEIKKEIYGEKHNEVAMFYNNIGVVYSDKSEFDKAFEYHLKSLEIKKEIHGEKHTGVAASYNNIGALFHEKAEYNMALEYYFKSLQIFKELLGETDTDVADIYNNIGETYRNIAEYDNALEYLLKGLEIRRKLLGEKHTDVATSYINIGNVYDDKKEYDKALEYHFKSLEICEELLGEKHTDAATSYNNIGMVYYVKAEYDKALDYFFKSLEIFRELFDEKHTLVATSYNNIGNAYSNLALHDQIKYKIALKYFHLGMAASLINYNDTSNVNNLPPMQNYFDHTILLKNLIGKAGILERNSSSLLPALRHFQAADTLIDQVRKKITTLSDKLTLGENAAKIYDGAIQVCLQLAQLSDEKHAEEYKQLAFYFSEKNKSQVLLQALSGQEAQKFAGIPDSLLEKERGLKVDINLYEQKLSEGLDSITETNFRNKLFTANRKYEELISNFETSYPEYFNLKYSTKNPSVKDLQKMLDAKTAIRSYFVGDSVIYIFTISNKIFDVQQVAKIDNLEDTIRFFRYGLTKFSQRMTDTYRRTGDLLYQQLFPESIALDNKIENLIIIPDGALATIPFEALLTNNMATIAAEDFKNYPFLIHRFNVSYSYSANLFYRTFQKEKQKQPELTNINDWLALAPVFDDKNEQGVMLATRELQKQLENLNTDSVNVRGRLLTGDYITPLPGTESETQAIIKEYENRNLKAQALLYQSANEQFIKSGGLEKYKVLHFATHGFVNSEKPELSGILLAQDSTGNQDGILYSGEIYNLKLNADLVVLSACETGLGKINKGEGIIGLTRALLYAGSKNIIVSLWQVSDESTSDLMIDFYNNLLNTKSKSFSDPLRKAKLQLISEGKFAHPFYWSPFILVGK